MNSDRVNKLQVIAGLTVGALLVKVLFTILLEYRWYFPPNFDESAFLTGRGDSFFGVYSTAFYAHIVVGPLVIVAGTFLMLTGKRSNWHQLHRPVGRVVVLVVLGILVPSGLVMARVPFGGPIAGYGFASLAVATGACAAVAFYHARSRRIRSHRIWAGRCFLLLCSPLLLRLLAGATIVTGWESEGTYRVIAWLSWLVPLAIYETWIRRTSFLDVESELQSIPHNSREASL